MYKMPKISKSDAKTPYDASRRISRSIQYLEVQIKISRRNRGLCHAAKSNGGHEQMNNRQKATLYLIVVAFAAFSIGYIYKDTHNIKTVSEVTEMRFIEMLNQKFAEAHEYDIKDYNCLNHSLDYAAIMRHLGYDISINAKHNNTDGHAWATLHIEIETVNGKVTKNSEIYPEDYIKNPVPLKYSSNNNLI